MFVCELGKTNDESLNKIERMNERTVELTTKIADSPIAHKIEKGWKMW